MSYDTRVEKLVTMKGIVTEWVWRNPHCFILYEVKDADGEAVQWTAETSSTFSMTGEFGWSRTTLNPGDEITISVAPSRAGTTAAGLLYKVVASDGEVLIEDPSRLLEERRPIPSGVKSRAEGVCTMRSVVAVLVAGVAVWMMSAVVLAQSGALATMPTLPDRCATGGGQECEGSAVRFP